MIEIVIFASLIAGSLGGLLGLLLAPEMKRAESVSERLFIVTLNIVFFVAMIGCSVGAHALLYILPIL